MSTSQIGTLLNFQSARDAVFVWDGFSSRPRHAEVGDDVCPWPVTFLLSQFSKKYIFNAGVVPKWNQVEGELLKFSNRLKWAFHFKDNNAPMEKSLAKVKRGEVQPYLIGGAVKPPPLEIQAFIQHLREWLLRKFTSVARWGKEHLGGNMLPVVKLAFGIMRSEGLAAGPTDKDGGFLVTKAANLLKVHSVVMTKPEYQQVFTSRVDWEAISQQYLAFVQEAAVTLDKKELVRPLRSSLDAPDALFSARVGLTAKTHKSSLEWRNLHCCPKWKFASLSQWVASMVEERLRLLAPHILKDSMDLVRRLKLIRLSSTFPLLKFATIDIKEYFMTGEAFVLAEAASKVFEGQLRLLMRNILFFLLDSQYVVNSATGGMYKVVLGSGMGLPHSGAVCDAAMFHLAEGSSMRSSPVSLVGYYRFKDDILAIYSARSEFQNFFQALRQRALPFKLKCEQVSSVGIDFLEAHIYKSGIDGCGKIASRPRIRDTGLSANLLAASSNHHSRIPRAWPRCLLARRAQLCTEKTHFEEEKQRLISRLKVIDTPFFIIEGIEAAEFVQILHKPRKSDCPVGTSIRTLRLILPYTKALELCFLSQQFHSFCQPWLRELEYVFQRPVQIQIGWKNCLPNVTARVNGVFQRWLMG